MAVASAQSLGFMELMQSLAACDDSPEGVEEFNRLVFGEVECEDGKSRSLHDGQARFIQRARSQVNLLSPGNSWGKTELVAREMVRRAWRKTGVPIATPQDWMHADWRGLICSYEYGTAGESFQRLLNLYNQRGNFYRLVAKVRQSEGEQQFVLKNGSIIDFGSLKDNGRHVEATRRNFIVVDEVGQIPDFEKTYNDVLYPRTMGVEGVIWLIGTPKPHTDPFVYHIFDIGLSGEDRMYFAMEGDTLRDNTFWTEGERERVRANPKLFNNDGSLTTLGRQVIKGEFVLSGGLFFNRVRVMRMFSGNWKFAEQEPQKGHQYLVAWDLGGRKKNSDATVCFVWDTSTKPWRVVAFISLDGGDADWQEKYDLIQRTYEKWKPPYVLVDVTGSTKDSVAEELENRGVPVEGVQFGGAGVGGKKFNMLRALQLATEMECQYEVAERDATTGEETRRVVTHKGLLQFPSVENEPELARVKKEFDFYVLKDEGLKQDCVMANSMLAFYALEEQVPEYTSSAGWSF